MRRQHDFETPAKTMIRHVIQMSCHPQPSPDNLCCSLAMASWQIWQDIAGDERPSCKSETGFMDLRVSQHNTINEHESTMKNT